MAFPLLSCRRRAVLAAGLASTAGLATPLHAAAPAWRFATAYGEGVHHTRNARRFVEEAAVAGLPTIELHTNASLKRMADILPAVAAGEVQMGEVLMSSLAAEAPLFNLDSLPFIVRSFEDAQLMWTVSQSAMKSKLMERGVRLLYAAPWPPQGLLSRVSVQQLSDLRGQRVRVYNDATRRLAEMAGAIPATIAASDLAAAVQGAQVDAILTSSITAVDSRAWTRMRMFYDVRAWIPKNMVCVHAASFDALPVAARDALLRAAQSAETRGWAMARNADVEALRTLAEQRIEIAAPSAELRRTLASLGERAGREWANVAGIPSAVILIEYLRQRG